MFSLYKLVLKTNVKSPSIMFPIIMPLIFLLIFSPGFTNLESVNIGVVSIIAVTTMQSGLMGFGFTFIGLKKSILLKRIGSTKITKFGALMGVALYGLTLFVFTTIWTFILVFLFSVSKFFGQNGGLYFVWANISWGVLIVSMILGLFVSYSIGMLILSVSKDDQQYSLLVMFYFFLASFLGGMLIPTSSNIEWMKNVGFLIPNVYNSHMFQAVGASKNLGDVFNFANGYSYDTFLGEVFVPGWEAALNFFVPIIAGTIALSMSVKLFKWD